MSLRRWNTLGESIWVLYRVNRRPQQHTKLRRLYHLFGAFYYLLSHWTPTFLVAQMSSTSKTLPVDVFGRANIFQIKSPSYRNCGSGKHFFDKKKLFKRHYCSRSFFFRLIGHSGEVFDRANIVQVKTSSFYRRLWLWIDILNQGIFLSTFLVAQTTLRSRIFSVDVFHRAKIFQIKDLAGRNLGRVNIFPITMSFLNNIIDRANIFQFKKSFRWSFWSRKHLSGQRFRFFDVFGRANNSQVKNSSCRSFLSIVEDASPSRWFCSDKLAADFLWNWFWMSRSGWIWIWGRRTLIKSTKLWKKIENDKVDDEDIDSSAAFVQNWNIELEVKRFNRIILSSTITWLRSFFDKTNFNCFVRFKNFWIIDILFDLKIFESSKILKLCGISPLGAYGARRGRRSEP